MCLMQKISKINNVTIFFFMSDWQIVQFFTVIYWQTRIIFCNWLARFSFMMDGWNPGIFFLNPSKKLCDVFQQLVVKFCNTFDCKWLTNLQFYSRFFFFELLTKCTFSPYNPLTKCPFLLQSFEEICFSFLNPLKKLAFFVLSYIGNVIFTLICHAFSDLYARLCVQLVK